jgi:hypothetical protein
MDIRTELSLINKHVRNRNQIAGSAVVWFQFLPVGEGSVYDDVYDEGNYGPEGRAYRAGIVLPTIYIDEQEDRFTLREDARQPTQNVSLTMLFDDVKRAGMIDPHEYQAHLNDVFLYDGRYFKVTTYKVRGSLRDDVIILVTGFETYYDQEFVFDPGPTETFSETLPWPTSFPSI